MNRWMKYFGGAGITARTLERNGLDGVFDICDFETCPRYSDACDDPMGVCPLDTYDGILEWLMGDAGEDE